MFQAAGLAGARAVHRATTGVPEVARLYVLAVCVCVIGTFIGSLTGEKTAFLYKETMGLRASDVTTLNLLVRIPIYFQPFLALFMDFTPVLGYRRRPWVALGVLIASSAYLALAFLPAYTYFAVAPLMLLLVLGGTMYSVILSGVIAAVGNRTGVVAKVHSLTLFAGLILSLTVTAHLGGYVAAHWSYRAAYGFAAGLALLLLPQLLLIPDPRVTLPRRVDFEARERHHAAVRQTRAATVATLRAAGRAPSFWVALGLDAFIALTPFPETAKLYFERDSLHFSKQFIGDLGAWASAGSIVGVLLMMLLSRRLKLRSIGWLYVGLSALVYPVWMVMRDPITARFAFFSANLLTTAWNVVIAVYISRLCPKGVESTVYALFAAVNTFFYFVCDKIGSGLYDYFGPENPTHHYTVAYGWNMSLRIGLAMTILAFGLVPFLPAWTRSTDSLSAPME